MNKERGIGKRGLSPIIATVLLITIALIAILLIVLWARSVVGEAIQKEGVAIELKCDEVVFKADVMTEELIIQNDGNIPLYGIRVAKLGAGGEEVSDRFVATIKNGETSDPIDISSLVLEFGDEVSVTPVIVGEQGNQQKQYPCTNQRQTVAVA